MSTLLTPPKSNIPIGSVRIDGKDLHVAIAPEWLRYLSQSLYERAGGYTSSGNLDEIADAALATDQLLSVAALQAEVDELRARIQELENGVQI